MHCRYPLITPNLKTLPVPCGQCLCCRINDRRVRTHRMMLESSCHTANSFLTITYSDENLPSEFKNEKTGQLYAENSVNPEHHRLFINRFRTDYRRKTGKEIKFYAVGEYGEKTGRPHYHYALFGFPSCLDFSSRKNLSKFEPCACRNCSFVSRHWPYGHVFLGSLSQHSAQYVAGYVTKKLTSDNSDFQNNILKGRHPEFARMSRTPALGKLGILKHLDTIKPYISKPVDLPSVLVHNGKKWPVGRYLREVMLKEMGWFDVEETETQKEVRQTHQMLSMFAGKTLTQHEKNLVLNYLPDMALYFLNKQSARTTDYKHELSRLNKGEF